MAQGRGKLPFVVAYMMCGWSKRYQNHPPFHIVGSKDGRHYSVAIRRDQLDKVIDELVKSRTEYDAYVAEV